LAPGALLLLRLPLTFLLQLRALAPPLIRPLSESLIAVSFSVSLQDWEIFLIFEGIMFFFTFF
jgi:hypothetical protein